MNIEQKIRNNAASFDDVKMPEGSRERFEARLGKVTAKHNEVPRAFGARNDRRLWLTWTTMAAAAVAVFIMVFGLNHYNDITTQVPQTADNKLVEMRRVYDERVDEAIYNLEEVMKNVDDSTKMQINAVIDGLLDMGDVFAELAPMPEERQMAIAEQIYDNNLRTLELLTDKLNK
ncbi:MAG: hypothetical protein IK004_07345 [Bacteroidales bacterium]|nr:hypothetical protein [Bacteroidales bacterium]